MARASGNALVRGGLTLVAGVLTGNIIGFFRVALTAYYLGTHSLADSLAVAMGPVDTLNSVLLNGIVFAFVPMLTAASGTERAALYRKLTRCFSLAGLVITLAVMFFAPWLMAVLAPGLDPQHLEIATHVMRILSVSSVAACAGAVQCALLFTERRFGPTAFYQAAINLFTIISALALYRYLGIYAFAIGYAAGALAQLAIVYFAARRIAVGIHAKECAIPARQLLLKPAFFAVYAAGLGANIVFTRAYATHAGPGMAAALDYCMRGVGVPLALLVNPITNSLLPEIARLRSMGKWRDAFRLIDRTTALAGALAVAGCAVALLFREPAIQILFQRGSFSAESTRMVSAVFLGIGPSLVGWSLMEIAARSLFALDRPWPPVLAAAVPILLNCALTLGWHSSRPDMLGLGASIGLIAGFLVVIAAMHRRRSNWPSPN